MSKTNLVRPSRDGDQFHYLWAARRCLKLLSAEKGLVAISIEGPSPHEDAESGAVDAGEELIDIAEYFESEEIEAARLVRYMQLKHSTLHASDPWTASGLEKTIKGFAKRYQELKNKYSLAHLAKKLEFWFVTNRPISAAVLDAFTDAAGEKTPRHPAELKKLQKFTGLAGSELAAFCKLFRFEDSQDGYWDQRNILFQEVSGYLPDGDVDAPTQLKELVTRRALSEGEQNPTITKIDVLRALKADEGLLFPAECLIEDNVDVVPREQESEIIGQIVDGQGPIVIHAPGGVGKSVFASQIGKSLPIGSTCILYDSFGNGQYRNATGYRHRHKDALVQIANELAAASLCHPLIPTIHADAAAYVGAFTYRLEQAVKVLRSSNPKAYLCIVVDAADNAQMAAEEIGESRSFVKDLIRIEIPEGVRLVFLCRSHRQDYLDPPINTIRIELHPFSRDETTVLLREIFPEANGHDVDEFHRLSSQNPRVQALALSRKLTLQDTLRLLGPNPTSVEDTISALLDSAIANLKDASGKIERQRVEKICAGLAALRPLIPIRILSAMSGVEHEAIKSFAFDIGRPLLVAGETIQFLDEPTETWFREKFKPSEKRTAEFIASLKPLANESAYVASALPQLMLEAGQFSELVELALSSSALPAGSPLEKRDVELQRLQFALKASLRSKHYLEATKLALKAGGETAGDDRQRKILQENTDLASDFLESELIQEIVSRRTFGSGWVGSHHAYEAALLSGRKEFVGDARSRLRMAYEWLENWSCLSPEERKNEHISDDDIVELTLAQLNIHGPDDAAKSLGNWTPKEVSYRVGRLVIRRLIDHGRWSDIDAMASAAGKNGYLVLAAIRELRNVHKAPPNKVIKKLVRQLSKKKINIEHHTGWDDGEPELDAVTAVIEVALNNKLSGHNDAVAILNHYLPSSPPRGIASRHSKTREYLLRAYCLRAALEESTIDLVDLAHAELIDEIKEDNKHSTSRELREFKEDVGALLPWHRLWVAVLLDQVKQEDIASEITKIASASRKAERFRYSEESHTSDEIALLWMDILHRSGSTDEESLGIFNQWKDKLKRALFTPTLNALCRLCAQCDETKSVSLAYATESYTLHKAERSDAESTSEGYLDVARAILATSRADAKAYFNEAVEVAGKIGEENLARWDAMLDLADRAALTDRPVPKVAYQFARCAELTYHFVVRDKHFSWNGTVDALCGLCPSSAITILSRWRDRGFGWHERLLPVAIAHLTRRNVVDPLDSLALIGFRGQWDYAELLESVLDQLGGAEEKTLASNILYRYAQFSSLNASDWENLQTVVSKHSISLEGLADTIASSEKEESVRSKSRQHDSLLSLPGETKAPQWDEIFASNDIATTDGLSQAYLAFQKTKPPRRNDNFFTEAMRRVPIGAEVGFIGAVADTPELSLYSFRSVLERVPDNWRGRPAICHAIEQASKVICRRYCMDIRKNRYYEAFPFALVSSLANTSQAEIIDVVLEATGETPDLIEASELFSLIGLLIAKLSNDESLAALQYGLDLFSPALEENDGDGPWSDVFAPPADPREAIAGYIWSALAAPEAVLRWEAAHAVFELCRLDRQEIIAPLMNLAATESGGPFVDAQLPFYNLHALQWLLIGLDRAAQEGSGPIAVNATQFVDWALNSQPHVLIRQFAARIALQLIDKGHLADNDGICDRLKAVNKSPFPIVDSTDQELRKPRECETNEKPEDDQYYFGMDIGPYWYKPLGRVFALSQGAIEAKALKIIRQDFGHSSSNRWDDERSKRSLYDDERSFPYKGDYPRVDNLHFYHCYHAMMIAAGQLLATEQTYQHPEYRDNDFTEWLSGHNLTRKNGRWLWDRRDPEPLMKSSWSARDKDHTDYCQVTDGDIEEALCAHSGLNLWGHWTEANTNQEQSVSIYSALVTPAKSEALLRALSTIKDVHDYAIPSTDSHMEIDTSGFELKGWITDHTRSSRLDKYDRWSGGVTFPPPRPAGFVIGQMKLESDSDCRIWRDQTASPVMQSQVWGHFDEAKRHERTNPNRGNRLQAHIPFIASMLSILDRDLIIEVQINKHRRYQPYSSSDEDDNKQNQTRAKLFLLDRKGQLRTC